MELMLSYENEQHNKRKRELLFKYRNDSFLKNYSFLYHIDGIVLNIEHLQDLVAISKKATRSFLLDNIFIDHIEPLKQNNDLLKLKTYNTVNLYPHVNFNKYNYLNIYISHLYEHYKNSDLYIYHDLLKNHFLFNNNIGINIFHQLSLKNYSNLNIFISHFLYNNNNNNLKLLHFENIYNTEKYRKIYKENLYALKTNNNDIYENISNLVINYDYRFPMSYFKNIIMRNSNNIRSIINFAYGFRNISIENNDNLRCNINLLLNNTNQFITNILNEKNICYKVFAHTYVNDQIYLYKKYYDAKKFENINLGYYDYILNLFDIKNINRDTYNMYLFKDFSLYKKIYSINIYENNYLYKHVYNLYNFKYESLNINNIYMNIYESNNLSSKDKHLNLFWNGKAYREIYSNNLLENISCIRKVYGISLNNSFNIYRSILNLGIFKNTFTYKAKYGLITNVFFEISKDKNNFILSKFNDSFNIFKDNPGILTGLNFNAIKKYNSYIRKFNDVINLDSSKYLKRFNDIYQIDNYINNKELYKDNYYLLNKDSHSFIRYDLLNVNKNNLYLYKHTNNNLALSKDNHKFSILSFNGLYKDKEILRKFYDIIELSNYYNKTINKLENLYAYLENKNFYRFNNIVSLNLSLKTFYRNNYNYSVKLSERTIIRNNNNDMLYKHIYKFNKDSEYIFINNNTKFLYSFNNFNSLHKDIYYMSIFNDENLLSKYRFYLKSDEYFFNLYKNIYYLQNNENNRFILLEKGVNNEIHKIYGSDLLYKHIKNMYVYKNYISLLKEYDYSRIINKNERKIIKNIIDFNCFDSQNNYSIISLNKYGKTLFTDLIVKNAIKNNTNINDYGTIITKVDKTIKNLFGQDSNLLLDKSFQNANILHLMNYTVIKNMISINLYSEEEFISKYNFIIEYISESNHISKYFIDIKDTNKENDFVSKFIKNVFSKTYFITHVHKIAKNVRIVPQEDKYQKIKYADALLNYERAKCFKIVYFDMGSFIHKMSKDTLSYKQPNYHVHKIAKDTVTNFPKIDIYKNQILETQKQIEEIHRHNEFTNNLFETYLLDKTNVISAVFPEYNELYRMYYEAKLPVDNIVDWAWIYEEDYDIDDPFTIDELLLPQNDTKYEDFEDIIFNRDTLTPRNPVKIIDDTTFIAKYPNHYPIKNKTEKYPEYPEKEEDNSNAYENIAVEYLDVRTSIMKKVFLAYYKIWQDNIFDFAKMTLVQSAKKILDYLYAWIMMSFNLDDIPEGLRCLRLIRWYLERSIIETSEYIISYTPDDMNSGKLDNTNLQIPNDLYMNASMYIDTTNHVIRNNLDMLYQPAYITFYIDNKKETTISFYLHTYTPVRMYLNGTLIDTTTLPTNKKMIYNIPYTGDVNEFCIKKFAVDNKDDDFFIGKIIVSKMGKTGDLDIQFNPKIEGNKVLNNTSQKIISYMNLYQDNEELMHELVRGNVHLDVGYDKLMTYWELHHQHKEKGKRLTIKRT